ncbi:MAG: hypothetical protein K6C41_08190 [Lachnospiraceae bacterium]|nr:hypothetical protein [Lachnospiraceae bacterium]
MTRRTFEALRDCASKMKGMAPGEAKIKEMFAFLSKVDRLARICHDEGPTGLRLEADNLPEETDYERAFKESILIWMQGDSVDKASDHAADRYFESKPSGYDAAIFFAAVYSVAKIVTGEFACGFIDMGLQYMLPDGWRWDEEDEKEKETHKGDENWFQYERSHRRKFLGDTEEENRHRFDHIRVCDLQIQKDDIAEGIGRKIADRLPEYKDGALQLILKELKYTDLAKSLYVLPKEAEDRIVSNLSSYCIPVIKGYCILNKDSVNATDIIAAICRFEEALNAYNGDPALEPEYES